MGGGGDAEETLRDKPTVPTPRNEAVTPRIQQILWPTGQEKAENSFPMSFVLSLCFSPKLWEVVGVFLLKLRVKDGVFLGGGQEYLA